VDVPALPGEVAGLPSADDGLPALGEDWASCVWGFEEELAGSLVQAVASNRKLRMKAAVRPWNRVGFIVVVNLPVG
jgi:hypothetical protein